MAGKARPGAVDGCGCNAGLGLGLDLGHNVHSDLAMRLQCWTLHRWRRRDERSGGLNGDGPRDACWEGKRGQRGGGVRANEGSIRVPAKAERARRHHHTMRHHAGHHAMRHHAVHA